MQVVASDWGEVERLGGVQAQDKGPARRGGDAMRRVHALPLVVFFFCLSVRAHRRAHRRAHGHKAPHAITRTSRRHACTAAGGRRGFENSAGAWVGVLGCCRAGRSSEGFGRLRRL